MHLHAELQAGWTACLQKVQSPKNFSFCTIHFSQASPSFTHLHTASSSSPSILLIRPILQPKCCWGTTDHSTLPVQNSPWFVFFGKLDKTRENNECPNLCSDTTWRVPSSQKEGVREQGREQHRSTRLQNMPRVCGEPWAGGHHSSDLQLLPEGAGMRWLMLMLGLAGKWRPLSVNVDLLKRNLSLWGQRWGVGKKKGSWTFKAGGWAVARIFLATHTAVLICCWGLLIFHLCHAKNS